MMKIKGRATKYTEGLATTICERLAEGESLREICRDPSMPGESTVRAWALDDREGFYAQYERARNFALDRMAEEVIEIADGPGDAANKRIRFDARRWYLSKLAPKRYGDRQQIEHSANSSPNATGGTSGYSDEELIAIIRTGQESVE